MFGYKTKIDSHGKMFVLRNDIKYARKTIKKAINRQNEKPDFCFFYEVLNHNQLHFSIPSRYYKRKQKIKVKTNNFHMKLLY